VVVVLLVEVTDVVDVPVVPMASVDVMAVSVMVMAVSVIMVDEVSVIMVDEVSLLMAVSVAAVSTLMFSSFLQPTARIETQRIATRVRANDFFMFSLLETDTTDGTDELFTDLSGCPTHLVSLSLDNSFAAFPRIK